MKSFSKTVTKIMRYARELYRYVKQHQGETGTVLIQVALMLLFVAATAAMVWYFQWSWIGFGILQGIFFGFIVGAIVIENLSPNKQIAAIGVVTGMTLDLIVSLRHDSPSTAITALADLIANSVNAVNEALSATGMPLTNGKALTWGLWVFIIIVGIIMIFGRVTARSKSDAVPEKEESGKVGAATIVKLSKKGA